MELDLTKTILAFAVIIAAGTAALLAMPAMSAGTVLTMVLPSMVVFGAITLAIGVAHGQYRATH